MSMQEANQQQQPQQQTSQGGDGIFPPGVREPLVFEDFQGVNTSTSRYGVDDRQAFWLDGFMPVGPKLARTMWGVGAALWTAPSANSISFYDFGNIGATELMFAILVDGSIYQVNTSTGIETQIAPPGTIQNPSRNQTAISQRGSQYIQFVSMQTNGYFIWDGTLFYGPGTLGPGVDVTAGGSGYVAPTVATSGGSGTGATFSVAVSGGVITGITITNPGSGWVADDSVTLVISDAGGSGATAEVILMPFAISGSAIENYSGRVWIAGGPTVTYSAPGSISDFSSANGGGNFTSTDSFLRVAYTQLKATNGFLYLIGDSSVNYISNVTTTGSPAVTTFTNQNADPQVGTPWPATLGVFGRNIVFANPFGVQISYGAAVTKISEPLDGVYNTVSNFAGVSPSSAQAIVFGKKVWILLLPIIDPISRLQVNKLLLWDNKRWWATEQDVALNYIQYQEINSVLTAYGTDGTVVYPLFGAPSVAFTKRAQSKFWARPTDYRVIKEPTRLYGIVQYYRTESPDIVASIDTETGSQDYTLDMAVPELLWFNASGDPITWTNASAQEIVWERAGVSIVPLTPVGQQGVLGGMTLATEAADMALVSFMMTSWLTAYRG